MGASHQPTSTSRRNRFAREWTGITVTDQDSTKITSFFGWMDHLEHQLDLLAPTSYLARHCCSETHSTHACVKRLGERGKAGLKLRLQAVELSPCPLRYRVGPSAV